MSGGQPARLDEGIGHDRHGDHPPELPRPSSRGIGLLRLDFLSAATYRPFTYGDAHNDADGAVADQLMWGGFPAPNGLSLMAFDVPPERPFERGTDSVFVSVRSDDPAEITRCYETLSEGAKKRTPLGPAPWGSPLYAMLDDRFGITWVMDVSAPH